MSLEIFIAVVGRDLLMGLNFGNVYSVSLRQQLQVPGGKDDLVQVSMEDRVLMDMVETTNNNSWVNVVVFDSCRTSPCSDGTEESTMYRFGSIGKNTQKIHWCCMDIGSRGAMILFKETKQGEVFDSTHQGLISFLSALCIEDVLKDF